MNDKLAAWEGAQKFANQFRGFMTAVEQLATVGSIEQAADEARARLEAVKREHEAFNQEAETQKQAAQETISAYTMRADSIVAEAKAQAAAIIENAQKHAAEHYKSGEKAVHDARNEAAAIVRSGHAEKRDILATVESKKREIEEKTKEHAEISAKVTERQAMLDRVNAQLHELRTKF